MAGRVATNIHRLVSDLWKDSQVEKDFLSDREAVFNRYELTREEKDALNNPDWRVLGELGVFPVSQVIFLLKAVPEIREHISMRKYVDQVLADAAE